MRKFTFLSLCNTLFVIAVSSFLLTSCVGVFTGAQISNVVAKESSSYKYIRTVEDKEQTTVVLGIGGLGKVHMTDMILKRLKNSLTSNQELKNIAVSVSTRNYVGVYATSIIEVTADVVEFIK